MCGERKQLGEACFMHVPANVPYVSYVYRTVHHLDS